MRRAGLHRLGRQRAGPGLRGRRIQVFPRSVLPRVPLIYEFLADSTGRRVPTASGNALLPGPAGRGTLSGMSLLWEEVVVDSRDPKVLGLWWRDALGWVVVGETDDELEIAPAEGAHPTLLFGAVPEAKSGKNRLHLDFVPHDQAAEVDRLLGLGATRAEVGQRDVPWVVLADPEGNEFCVLAAR
jgi:hypothetical protein